MAQPKTYVVTGGNTGLGFQCASVLAGDGGNRVVIACRDAGKGEQAVKRLRGTGGKAEVLPLDLASQPSIHSFVDALRARGLPPLAGLVCNAGGQSIVAPTKTADGYEMTFAVNHLGHYLLTRLLLPDLSEGARIVFVASGVHDPKAKTGMPEPRYVDARAVAHDFEPGVEAGKRRYTTSKLCNVYDTYELARRLAVSPDPRLQSIRVDAFDPGLMPGTGLARTYSGPLRFIWNYLLPLGTLFYPNVNSSAKSGRRLAQLAAGQHGGTTGKYFSNGREIPSSELSYDTANARDLWNTSADMTHLPHGLEE
jgi:NAD(P)-dependent dehydrogenase (short-subunit alcohol dehydrogenase family)